MKCIVSMAIFVLLFLLMNSAPHSQAIDIRSAYHTVSEQVGTTLSSILPEKKTADLVDLKETPDAHYITIDAPGTTPSSILPEKKTTDLVDLKETPDAHYITIDAPGTTPSSILPEKKTTDLVDWKETPDAHYIMIDAPGLRVEDIKIVVEGNGMLKVTGERNKEAPKKKDIWHRRERFCWFYQEFQFSNIVNLDSVTAKLEDGVLTLFLKKIKAPRVVKIANKHDL